MRSILLIALFGLALANKIHLTDLELTPDTPTPPPIAKQFRTNFTLSIVDFNSNPNSLFQGYLAVDYVNGGGLFSFGGEEYIPLYFHTNLIASPNAANITGYMFQEQLCWNTGMVPLDYLQIFPIEIPSNATYIGQQTVNGIKCTVWLWPESFDYYGADIEMWVSQSNDAIVRIVMTQIEYIGELQWDFSNTQVGKFNPDIYSPPNLDCPPIPFFLQAPKALPLDLIISVAKLLA